MNALNFVFLNVISHQRQAEILLQLELDEPVNKRGAHNVSTSG